MDDPNETVNNDAPPQPPAYALAAKVLAPAGSKSAHIDVRNQIRLGDPVEIVKPHGPSISDSIKAIINIEGDRVEIAQPGSRVTITLSTDCEKLDLLRRKI